MSSKISKIIKEFDINLGVLTSRDTRISKKLLKDIKSLGRSIKSVNSDIVQSKIYNRVINDEPSRNDLVTQIEHLKQENKSLKRS